MMKPENHYPPDEKEDPRLAIVIWTDTCQPVDWSPYYWKLLERYAPYGVPLEVEVPYGTVLTQEELHDALSTEWWRQFVEALDDAGKWPSEWDKSDQGIGGIMFGDIHVEVVE